MSIKPKLWKRIITINKNMNNGSLISEQQKAAIKYLVDLLNKNNIPYQTTGGFASICYGAKRPLYDIDIDVNKRYIPLLQKLLKQYIIDDYHHYQDDHFDIYMIRAEINNVSIDISQIENAYCLKKGNKFKMNSNIANSCIVNILGMNIRVQDIDELIEYKLTVGRDTDLLDVKEIQFLISS